jgi:uncharacterized protein (TIGR00369 family)
VSTLDAAALQAILTTSFPDHDVPVVEWVGHDTVTVALPVTERHGRPGGTLSGPAIMMLADTAAWVAILARVGPRLLAVTSSLHIDFFRKPTLTDLVAQGRLLKLGRTLAVVDVELFSRGERALVAKAQVTYSLPPESDEVDDSD